jgi:hypothetical protein
MTYTGQAIEKTIHGGWRFKENNFAGNSIENNQFLLNREFWQALGKTLGWEENWVRVLGDEKNWRLEWHNFINHLADGKDTESFFEQLLK